VPSEDGAEHASVASLVSSSTMAPSSSEEALSPSSSPSSQTEHTVRSCPSTPSSPASPASGHKLRGHAGIVRHRHQQWKSGDEVNAWEEHSGHATRKKSGKNTNTPGHLVWRPKGTSA
jgi:hypothetical protein